MDQKINLDEIINQMNEKYPEGYLTELDKARYLYIEFGKRFSFNLDYISEDKYKTEDAYYEVVDVNDITKSEYTCRQISMIYLDALRRVGIDAEVVSQPKTEEEKRINPAERLHKYVIVKFKDGRNIIADLVNDLGFIKKGLETLHFGRDEESLLDNISTIDREELLSVDYKIGYAYPKDIYNTSQVYMNDFIQMVKQDMENEEHFREFVAMSYSKEEAENLKNVSMIKYKFDIISRFFNTSSLGAREGKMFLDRLIKEFFTEEEQNDILDFSLTTEHKEPLVIDGIEFEGSYKLGKTDLVKCYVWKKGKDDYEYYLYEEGKNLRRIDREELNEFLKKEQYINKYTYGNRIPGIKYGDEER